MSEPGFCVASCQQCGEHIEFPVGGHGMRVQCPHCAAETVLIANPQQPEPQPAFPSAAAQEITAAELKEALSEIVPRRRISVFYQIGLLLVALFMVFLPLAYLAFIGLVAYCTYWYAIHARVIMTSFEAGGRVYILRAVAYIGPILAGGIAVFFMFKPILARKRKGTNPIELNPAQHPRLYQFIAHLCEVLRVAMPKRVYLSCDLNASAGFRRGWLSFFGNDLALTIGLPLVAGLNTRQLAAVIAHELGHCTQAFAMRVGYVINNVDGWFYRVTCQRDTWDDAVEEWQNSADTWWMSLLVLLITLAVWLSRMVLQLLMLIGHFASCFLSRQMEYHADHCAMAVAGSDGLESLLVRLREQSVLESLAYDGLGKFWKHRHQLPDCLPDFLDELERRLPRDFHEQARMTLINERPEWLATHPTAAQRIRKARQRSIAGIFALEKPARLLFSDFAGTAQLVTFAHYR
jgi:Zn-dependent protease with chaperone function